MKAGSVVACVAILALWACSTTSSSPSGADVGPQEIGDGSTAGCTAVGGTCQPTMAPGCSPLEQNPALCGDTLLVCCLPPDAEPPSVGQRDDAGADASMQGSPDTGIAEGAPDANALDGGGDSTTLTSPTDATTPADVRAADVSVE